MSNAPRGRLGNGGRVVVAELGEESAREIGEDGELRFRWGNICMHFMTVDFLERCAKVGR